MGASSSKVAKSASSATKRKLPTTSTLSSTITQRPSVPPSSKTNTSSESYPSPSSSQSTQQSQPAPGPTVQPSLSTPSGQPSTERNEFIDLDARDPTFSSKLRSIGPVNPMPTGSHSATFGGGIDINMPGVFPENSKNPALMAIKARQQIAQRVEQESEGIGRRGFAGRTTVDASTLGAIIRARQTGQPDALLEERWQLKKGILEERLGKPGAVVRAIL